MVQLAWERKDKKYHFLSSPYIFQPIAMENLDAFSSLSLEFLRELGRTCRLNPPMEKSERPAFFSSTYRLQYNDLIRCFCTMASLMAFRTSSHFSCFYPFCFNPRALYTRGYKKKKIIIAGKQLAVR